MVSIGNFRNVNAVSNTQTQKQVSFGMHQSNSMIIVEALAKQATSKQFKDFAAHHPNPPQHLIEAIMEGTYSVSKSLKDATHFFIEQLTKSNADLRPDLSKRITEAKANHLNLKDAQKTVGDALIEHIQGVPKEEVMRHFDRISDTSKYPDPDFSKMFS